MSDIEKAARRVKERLFHNPEDAYESAGDWKVRGCRIYQKHCGLFAWKPLYYLIKPDGQQCGGYANMRAFLSWAKRFIKEQEQGCE